MNNCELNFYLTKFSHQVPAFMGGPSPCASILYLTIFSRILGLYQEGDIID